ncbi:glycosyltransferase family 2 protein [Intestinibacter bartlettii]|uniref:Glycosyltransferase family 2 protein n=1 Tax=Intestinibacter bartlettii TaxID=261299 RepID=A0ABS6DU49_9FIRM|nr:glycosyltransferase family 2 protein [Intestinibacter bartlettii]MBU5335363.1 glycosyltransferase family 2 protein [Intestinibacter bartlettii]MDO5009253.1 glycosyltransferase family 2 protein [Intestinibacter bartlettii]
MLEILFILVGIMSVYCFVIETYSVFLSIFGYKKLEKYYTEFNPEAKFLILVAAHNEEDVIESTLKNLEKIDYPKELFDLYVVNDNSTDSTGVLCDKRGAMHIDTIEKKFPREGVGKSAGLQYALRALGFEKLKEKYDMLLVLDADNHVDSNILREINSQWLYEGKPEAIQTYLDSKNARSLIATGYATAYNITNRFFQLSKKRIGLNNAIGGTGFAVRMDWLINTGGFCYKSLVEDLEMSIEIFKSGGQVSWNHFTRIYDEKPDTLKISIKQRIRWCQGHWYVAFTNAFELIKGFFKSKCDFRYIDQLLYLFNMGKSVQLLILITSFMFSEIIVILGIINAPRFNLTFMLLDWIIPTNFIRVFLAMYSYIWLPLYANKIDGTHKTNPIKTVCGVFVVGVTYIYTQIVGLIKWRNQSTWVKTPHKHKEKNIA